MDDVYWDAYYEQAKEDYDLWEEEQVFQDSLSEE